MQVSPAQIAGVARADNSRIVSPEAQDIVDRMKDHYRSQGKPSAAHNYSRHLKSFFAWAEGVGYSVKNMPVDAVESFLASLSAAGQKELTVHVMRSQLKSALKEAHNVLGLDFAHLEYQTGKPAAVKQRDKAKEKAKRAEAKAQQIMAQAAAIQAAQQMLGATPGQPIGAAMPPNDPSQTFDPASTPEYSMSAAASPAPEGAQSPGGATTGQSPVVVVQMPPQNQRPMATIGGAAATKPAAPATAARGVAINNHTFTGPYVRISRIADGSEPLIPPGTETYVQTLPASQLSPHGDIAGFLQTYIVPNLRLAPMVSQVQFVFHELNDRRMPTGRRDELVVSVPMNGTTLNGMPSMSATQPPLHSAFVSPGGMVSQPPAQDAATTYLLKKLDEEAAEAKKRAEDYQHQMREAKDAQTTFMLMQQFQKEQDLRRELEERKAREIERMREPPAPPPQPMMPPMPFPPYIPPPPVEPTPRVDGVAEMVKAMSEQQAKIMEIVAASMKPAPPQPQKDVAEWLVPFIAQMNQQAQAQAQANQQMLMSVMQGNQQFMQALLTRENPTERLLMQQLMEVKAAANSPKEDELEAFADKLQKMKMVGEMIGGGGGQTGLLSELLANADTIGAGAARVIAAARSGNGASAAPQPTQRVMVQGAPTQALPPPQQRQTQAPQTQAGPTEPPKAATDALAATLAATEANDDQGIVNGVMAQLRAMIEAPEPFAGMGRRLLSAFKEADDEGELYTFAKNLWAAVGQKYDRPAAKVIARTLARWYSEIHLQVFGDSRDLPGAMETDGITAAVNAAVGEGEPPQIDDGEEEEPEGDEGERIEDEGEAGEEDEEDEDAVPANA